MQPTIDGYSIQKEGAMHYVASKYDLMHLNQWHRCSPNYDTADEAYYHLQQKIIDDCAEYERLKARGRSFPDND